jgi:hypothetical protein
MSAALAAPSSLADFISTVSTLDVNRVHVVRDFVKENGIWYAFRVLRESEGFCQVMSDFLLNSAGKIEIRLISELEEILTYYFTTPEGGKLMYPHHHKSWDYPQLKHVRICMLLRKKLGCDCGVCQHTMTLKQLVHEMLVKSFNKPVDSVHRFFDVYHRAANERRIVYKDCTNVKRFDISPGRFRNTTENTKYFHISHEGDIVEDPNPHKLPEWYLFTFMKDTTDGKHGGHRLRCSIVMTDLERGLEHTVFEPRKSISRSPYKW